jgi:hypothetical protein
MNVTGIQRENLIEQTFPSILQSERARQAYIQVFEKALSLTML